MEWIWCRSKMQTRIATMYCLTVRSTQKPVPCVNAVLRRHCFSMCHNEKQNYFIALHLANEKGLSHQNRIGFSPNSLSAHSLFQKGHAEIVPPGKLITVPITALWQIGNMVEVGGHEAVCNVIPSHCFSNMQMK